MAYEASLKVKWDTQNAFDSVRREALREGINEGKAEVVKNLLLDFGFTDEQAASAATVPIGFVRKVRSALQNQQ